MSRNKKTPMFESAMPTAYDFVDFTSPKGQTALSNFGRDLNGSQIVNQSIDETDKVFSHLQNKNGGESLPMSNNNRPFQTSASYSTKPLNTPNRPHQQFEVYQNGHYLPVVESMDSQKVKNVYQASQQQINTMRKPQQQQQNLYQFKSSYMNKGSKQVAFNSLINQNNQPEILSKVQPSNNLQRRDFQKGYPGSPMMKRTPQGSYQSTSYQTSQFNQSSDYQPRNLAQNNPTQNYRHQEQYQPPQPQLNFNNPIYSPKQDEISSFRKNQELSYQRNEQKSSNWMAQSTPPSNLIQKTRTQGQGSGMTDESLLDLLPEPSRSNLKAILQRSKTQNN